MADDHDAGLVGVFNLSDCNRSQRWYNQQIKHRINCDDFLYQ